MDSNFYANYVCMSLAEFEAFINCNFIFQKQNYFSIFYYKMDNYVTLLHAKNWTFFGFLFLDSRVHQQLMLLLPSFMITSFISFIELRNHLGRLYNNTTVHTWFNAQASVVAPGLRSVTETGHAGQGDGYIYIQPLQSSTGQVVWWYCQHVDLQVRHCLAKKENHITYAYSKSIFQGVVYMPWIDSSISWYQDVKIHSLF